MTIRDAVPGDADAIARLLDQLGYATDPRSVSRRLARLGQSGADRLFVAEIDGEVVGLAGIHVSPSVEYDEDAAKVSALVVDEAHRRSGIGQALVRRVEEEARARSCCALLSARR